MEVEGGNPSRIDNFYCNVIMRVKSEVYLRLLINWLVLMIEDIPTAEVIILDSTKGTLSGDGDLLIQLYDFPHWLLQLLLPCLFLTLIAPILNVSNYRVKCFPWGKRGSIQSGLH